MYTYCPRPFYTILLVATTSLAWTSFVLLFVFNQELYGIELDLQILCFKYAKNLNQNQVVHFKDNWCVIYLNLTSLVAIKDKIKQRQQ